MKRVRSGKEDSFRWFENDVTTPNGEQFGRIGDGVVTPRVCMSAGGGIVLTTDCVVPDIVGSGNWVQRVLKFTNPIHRAQGLDISSLLVLGMTVIAGAALTGDVGPQVASGSTQVTFRLSISTNGTFLQTLWESANVTLNNTPDIYAVGTQDGSPTTAFQSISPIGVNSLNSGAAAPYNQIDLTVTNQTATAIVGGNLRLCLWAIET